MQQKAATWSHWDSKGADSQPRAKRREENIEQEIGKDPLCSVPKNMKCNQPDRQDFFLLLSIPGAGSPTFILMQDRLSSEAGFYERVLKSEIYLLLSYGTS